MAWRPHSRARIDSAKPQAVGCCDRCGFWFNLVNLRWQFDWRGDQVVNIKFRVCCECYDRPYQGRRPLKLPADPPPVLDARPIRNAVAEENVPSTYTLPTFALYD